MRFLPLLFIVVVGFLDQSAHAQDAALGKEKAQQVCAACHGMDGNSVSGEYPSLAGQTARYIYVELKDYQAGRRKHPIMSAIAAPLSREDMFNLGAYFASLPLKSVAYPVEAERVARGKAITDNALCTMCHLGGFSGQNEIPRVAGQRYEYILGQLKAFKNYERTNDAGNMASVAKALSDEDMVNIAQYITSIKD